MTKGTSAPVPTTRKIKEDQVLLFTKMFELQTKLMETEQRFETIIRELSQPYYVQQAKEIDAINGHIIRIRNKLELPQREALDVDIQKMTVTFDAPRAPKKE